MEVYPARGKRVRVVWCTSIELSDNQRPNMMIAVIIIITRVVGWLVARGAEDIDGGGSEREVVQGQDLV